MTETTLIACTSTGTPIRQSFHDFEMVALTEDYLSMRSAMGATHWFQVPAQEFILHQLVLITL